jgi:hypothetical protein
MEECTKLCSRHSLFAIGVLMSSVQNSSGSWRKNFSKLQSTLCRSVPAIVLANL